MTSARKSTWCLTHCKWSVSVTSYHFCYHYYHIRMRNSLNSFSCMLSIIFEPRALCVSSSGILASSRCKLYLRALGEASSGERSMPVSKKKKK